MMHNRFLESGEGTPVPGTCRKWSNCFDFYFDNKVDSSGKDFILGLSDDWKSSDFQNR